MAPDILVWSARQARASRGLARLLGGHQAVLFFPLLALEGFHLHVASVRALRSPYTHLHRVGEPIRRRRRA